MLKATIVFHSVCGNGHLVARAFFDGLKQAGVAPLLYRVADPAWVEKPDLPPEARANLLSMRALTEATPQALEDADIIIMGSPTYFGNVSAPMKAFMDATGGLWVKGKLAGKKFAAFTSAGNMEGGGDLCLAALHTYAKYMGMLSVPMPVTAWPGENLPALGVIQYSSGKYGHTLDQRTKTVVDSFCRFLVK